ncbi:unnamed protein product, partial [Vicia faba]
KGRCLEHLDFTIKFARSYVHSNTVNDSSRQCSISFKLHSNSSLVHSKNHALTKLGFIFINHYNLHFNNHIITNPQKITSEFTLPKLIKIHVIFFLDSNTLLLPKFHAMPNLQIYQMFYLQQLQRILQQLHHQILNLQRFSNNNAKTAWCELHASSLHLFQFSILIAQHHHNSIFIISATQLLHPQQHQHFPSSITFNLFLHRSNNLSTTTALYNIIHRTIQKQ